MTRPGPSFTRLDVEERRQLLLDQGRALFTSHAYDELSMSAIAKQAGISKALLYHYFPSKQAFFVATLQEAAHELAERVRPDPSQPARVQLESALGAWLQWVDGNRESYGRLMRAAGAVAEVRVLIDSVREATVALILERLGGGAEPAPELRSAVGGWLWFMDGVCLDWVAHGDLEREQVQGLLAGALPGALAAAGHAELARSLS